jgi:hypothetical protein
MKNVERIPYNEKILGWGGVIGEFSVKKIIFRKKNPTS